MIKVYVNKNKIVIAGHAGFACYGKDVVCASASSIVITSINACLRIDQNSLIYKEEYKGKELSKLTIEVTSDNKSILLIIENMIEMLEELALTYKKNIKIIKED